MEFPESFYSLDVFPNRNHLTLVFRRPKYLPEEYKDMDLICKFKLVYYNNFPSLGVI